MLSLNRIIPSIYDAFDGIYKDSMSLELKILNEITLLNPIGYLVEYQEDGKIFNGKVVGGDYFTLIIEVPNGYNLNISSKNVKFLQ